VSGGTISDVTAEARFNWTGASSDALFGIDPEPKVAPWLPTEHPSRQHDNMLIVSQQFKIRISRNLIEKVDGQIAKSLFRAVN
jgi:hypothetical protein